MHLPGAASKPDISIEDIGADGVALKCVAEAWSFKPEMIWLDSVGTVLSADGPTEIERDPEGHYTVRGHVTVQKTDNNRFNSRRSTT
ncbi:hypothetical protein DPEC_G00258750 [Dallia pectoralis]|uniref:Uncharacterized protein n=1 Tax=Dallia pectoralis TaxID=75939 RepID=A0ACC2FRC2_DALPE|nr:hypothetical protein DPEC_G00258750 [Dallia pectoralis]